MTQTYLKRYERCTRDASNPRHQSEELCWAEGCPADRDPTWVWLVSADFAAEFIDGRIASTSIHVTFGQRINHYLRVYIRRFACISQCQKLSNAIMELLTFLHESRAQLWHSWGWLSLAIFVLITVRKPSGPENETDKECRRQSVSQVMLCTTCTSIHYTNFQAPGMPWYQM